MRWACSTCRKRKPDDARKRYEQMLAKDPKNEQLLLALAELSPTPSARRKK